MKSHAWHRRFMQLGGILALALLVHLGGPPDAQSQAAIGSGICSADTTRQCAVNNDCTNPSAGTCILPTAGGDTIPNAVCMQTAAGFALQCTANDVRIARTTHLTYDPCTQPGATTKISFVAEFNLTAQDRYDIGVWVAEDGGNALTGSCSVSNFPVSPAPPWTNLDGGVCSTRTSLACTTVGSACTGTCKSRKCTNDSSVSCTTNTQCNFGTCSIIPGTSDTCGDITQTNNPLHAAYDDIIVECKDTNGDGNLDISTCLSWKQAGDNGLCKTPLDSVPGSPSKCSCQILPGITIPVPGIIKVDKVTNPASDPTSFSFTLSSGPQSINTPFTLTDTTTPFNSGPLGISLTQPYSVVETVPAGWTQSSATCVSDQSDDPSGLPKRTYSPTSIVLHNGETVTCTFNNQKQCPSCPTDPACGFYTCDASSKFACLLNNSPSTTVCRSAAGECDVAENCTGSSPTCPADTKQPAGTVCADDGNVCTRDICDGTSNACTHPAGNGGTTCRASAGACDPAEACDGVSTACPADAKSTALCRASAGECDPAESCDGTNNNCPADAKQAAGTACTDDGNVCTRDICDGSSNACTHPAGNVGTTCRALQGQCDLQESCDGVNTACPADAKSTAVCRPSAGICDVDEKCDGVSNDCPTDAFQPSSTACRPAAGDCDAAENCTGSSAACPTDGFKAAGALCSFDADACITSQCNGSGDCVAGNAIPITGPGTPCASDGECGTDGLCAPPNTCLCAVSGSGGVCVVRKAQN